MLRVLLISAIMFAFPTAAGAFEIPASTTMRVGTITSIPIGHFEFCQLHYSECSIRLTADPLPLTPDLWNAVGKVNVLVNTAIRPLNDIDIYGHGLDEVWAYPDRGVGDCEDYVLEKRRRLHDEIGISLANLLITVVRKPDGEGHAILTVRTDQGDYVLDNLRNNIKAWHDTGYKFLKRQASTHTGRWVKLIGSDGELLTAANQ